MLDLKGMGFDMDFAANKLKQAAGEHVCRVLLFLADRVSLPLFLYRAMLAVTIIIRVTGYAGLSVSLHASQLCIRTVQCARTYVPVQDDNLIVTLVILI